MPNTERCFNLVDWRVDPALNRLSIDDQDFELEPRVMKVLVCLYKHAEELVSKDEMVGEVWHGVSITDDAIYCSISKLRKTFRQVDEYRSPQLKTIARQGYMLSLTPAYQVLQNGFDLNQKENGLCDGQAFGRRHDDKVSEPVSKANGNVGRQQKSSQSLKKPKRLAIPSELKPIKLKFYLDARKTEERPKTQTSQKTLKVLLLFLLLVLFVQSIYIASL